MEYQKAKSTPKLVKIKGEELTGTILDTINTISTIVGATLGPGGCPVAIERYEHDLPPIITKDGVTVFKALGFQDPVRQVILEAFRSSAQRTATTAGDGTTTATVLGEAIFRLTNEYCKKNPKVSPQKVVRHLQNTFKNNIEPALRKWAIKANSSTEEGAKVLSNVATISANSDKELSKAVMECFELVGDSGNITISEADGESRYEVVPVKGYTIGVGYDESCGKFFSKFINDPTTQQCKLDNPVFVVYNGTISEPQVIMGLLSRITDLKTSNIVLVSAGFSETAIGYLAAMFDVPTAFKIFPLSIARPTNAMFNSQHHLFEDICAIAGCTMFDPLSRPLYTATLEDLGPGVERFEAARARSNIVGTAQGKDYEDALMEHIAEVMVLADSPEGDYEKGILQERVGKLTGGIARLVIYGASNGDVKERKDRADDAICSVRSAISDGVLPGGGWALLNLAHNVLPAEGIDQAILFEAFKVPVDRLLTNCGFNEEEKLEITNKIVAGFSDPSQSMVYDAYNQIFTDAMTGGILDSVLAVLEAIRSSLSIASVMGTLGGLICFGRDLEYEAAEAHATAAFLRDSNINESNERA